MRKKSLAQRIAAYARHAKANGTEATAPARAAFIGKWEQVVDPDRRLAPDDRARRAHAALREHMLRLSLRSRQQRQGRK